MTVAGATRNSTGLHVARSKDSGARISSGNLGGSVAAVSSDGSLGVHSRTGSAVVVTGSAVRVVSGARGPVARAVTASVVVVTAAQSDM